MKQIASAISGIGLLFAAYLLPQYTTLAITPPAVNIWTTAVATMLGPAGTLLIVAVGFVK